MKQLKVNGKQFTLPDSFNEAPRAALLAFVQHVYLRLDVLFRADKSGNVKILDPLAYRKAMILLLKTSLCSQKGKPIGNRLFWRFTPEQISDLLYMRQVMAFFFQQNLLTKNPFPVLKAFKTRFLPKRLYGPKDNFANMTIEEYSWADTFYLRYKKTGNKDLLDKVVAILYRPLAQLPSYEDMREPFNLANVDERLRMVAKIPFLHKLCVLFWFEGCRNASIKRHKKIYENNGQKAENGNWLTVLLALSGDKFGTYDQTKSQPFELVFTELSRMASEAERINEAYNK